jgi:hypothetical protein
MRNVPRVLLPSLLAFLMLAGCGGDEATPDDSSADRPASTASARSTDPTAAATPTEPVASASGTEGAGGTEKDDDQKLEPPSVAARAAGPNDHLLTASSLPRLAGREWTVGTTGAEESQPVGACQKTALVDIGAVRAVRRVFSGPGDSGVGAAQVVARFADKKSAWRAHQVLQAWRDDCPDRLRGSAPAVGPMEEVSLTAGTGGHYRATWGSTRKPVTAGLGIVRKGAWLSVVELTAADADYPAGRHPARRAVRRIAATFA